MNTETSAARPKVSILMITYNHEKYIEQAVYGVMMQETNFNFELIIGDDCSTDLTREIVLRLKREFPDKIKLILHQQNVGANLNFITIYHEACGQYIALCEGDDYWTNVKKLQKQADYLDSHPDCRLCIHSAEVRFENDPHQPSFIVKPNLDEPINFKTWQRDNYLTTATIVFRSLNKSLPDWYYKLKTAGDWPLYTWLLNHGDNIGFIDEVMCVYRKHPTGATHPLSLAGTPERRNMLLGGLNDISVILPSLPTSFRRSLRSRYYRMHIALAGEFNTVGDFKNARHHLWKAIYYLSPVSHRNLSKVIKMIIRCYLPKLHRDIRIF